MIEKEFKKNLNIRPNNDNLGMIEHLEVLAKRDGRTLNNYIVRLLVSHIQRNKSKINGR